MSESNDTSIAAMQFVLMALIGSHPDIKALLSQFDTLSSQHQIAAIATGGTGTPSQLRAAVDTWRAVIANFL